MNQGRVQADQRCEEVGAETTWGGRLPPEPDESDEEELLADESNTESIRKKTSYYILVYNSPSSSSDAEPLSNFISSISNVEDRKLIDKENIHPSKISEDVHVVVKVSSVMNKHYTYLGVAKSEVDEEGESKILFYETGWHWATVQTSRD
ncbi:hypothetical protein HHI36_012936 [Cryptolaemus montrouzieri]|uniref:Uncharacterized protein n=1 Tax=Cryptolaemus montrouzieri TaxID=559131 RepID=A0ABD2NGH6_9CUCU